MRIRSSKIILIISLLPYAFLLVMSLYCAFEGVSVFFSTASGINAFFIGFLWYGWVLVFAVPLIPLCLTYQVFYIVRANSRKAAAASPKKFWGICAAICGAVVFLFGTVWLIPYINDKINDKLDHERMKNLAVKMYEAADERVPYRDEYTVYVGGGQFYPDAVFDVPELRSNYILIDYDGMEIGFITRQYIDIFIKTSLKEITPESAEYASLMNDHYVQAEIPLGEPNARLLTFHERGDIRNRTTAVLIERGDGTLLFGDGIFEEKTGGSFWSRLDETHYFIGEKAVLDSTGKISSESRE